MRSELGMGWVEREGTHGVDEEAGEDGIPLPFLGLVAVGSFTIYFFEVAWTR